MRILFKQLELSSLFQGLIFQPRLSKSKKECIQTLSMGQHITTFFHAASSTNFCSSAVAITKDQSMVGLVLTYIQALEYDKVHRLAKLRQ
jgi:hypothetical protein